MNKPKEFNYSSHAGYTRALEEYCLKVESEKAGAHKAEIEQLRAENAVLLAACKGIETYALELMIGPLLNSRQIKAAGVKPKKKEQVKTVALRKANIALVCALEQSTPTVSSIDADEALLDAGWARNKAVKAALRDAIAQPESEPYGWMVEGVPTVIRGSLANDIQKLTAKRIGGTCNAFPIYAAPVQPAYVPLSDDQIDAVTTKQWGSKAVMPACRAFARAIEKAVRGQA